MIVTSNVPFNNRDTDVKARTSTKTRWCQTCGQPVPPSVSVCYGCDVEMGVGDWPIRPRRQANFPGRFRGLRRMPKRLQQ